MKGKKKRIKIGVLEKMEWCGLILVALGFIFLPFGILGAVIMIDSLIEKTGEKIIKAIEESKK